MSNGIFKFVQINMKHLLYCSVLSSIKRKLICTISISDLLLWIFYVFVLSCVCYVCARLFICALWSPAGKGLTSWLSFVVSSVSLSLSHWYPGSGVVLDCIDS